jgi:hypothetical protein
MSKLTTKLLFSIGAVVLILIRRIQPSLLPADAVTLGLLVVAVLPWISSFIDIAEFPGGWKFQFRELEATQKRQNREIESLKFLIKYFVTDRELEHLRKVASGVSSSYDYDDYQRGIFATELRRLRSFDLIQMQPDAYVADMPKKGDLRDYCKITERGEMYLKLRQEVDSQS